MLYFVVVQIVFDDRPDTGLTQRHEGVKNDSKVFDLTNQKNIVAVYSLALSNRI